MAIESQFEHLNRPTELDEYTHKLLAEVRAERERLEQQLDALYQTAGLTELSAEINSLEDSLERLDDQIRDLSKRKPDRSTKQAKWSEDLKILTDKKQACEAKLIPLYAAKKELYVTSGYRELEDRIRAVRTRESHIDDMLS